MLRVAAYLAGGFAVLLAMDFVAASSGSLATTPAAQAEIATATSIAVDRSLKGDRLTALRPAYGSQLVVASGDRRAMPRLDPTNVTVITKGAPAPKADVQRGIPVRAPESAPHRKLLDGCDPSFSPVAAPSLSHITGRCIAESQGATKLAALHN